MSDSVTWQARTYLAGVRHGERLGVYESQQIGISHPAVKDVLHIQNDCTKPVWVVRRRRSMARHGRARHGLRIDTLYWCPELVHSDEAKKRGHELAERARRSCQVSEKTMARIAERGNPDGIIATVEMPTLHPEEVEFAESALVLVTDGIESPATWAR